MNEVHTLLEIHYIAKSGATFIRKKKTINNVHKSNINSKSIII